MWAHIPQTPQAAVIGNMMPYPTQPLQYQPCFVPPVQPSNHGMYFNNQVQSYSLMPQPYLPVPTNRGFRQPVGMRQPSNMPYIMQQDYMPVTPPMGSTGIAPPQPPQTHPRPPVYELSCVQQAQQYAPQCSKPLKYFSAFVQKRSGILSQEAYYQHSETNLGHIDTCEEKETPRLPAKSDEQCGNPDVHPLQEEESAEVNKQIIDANSLSISPVERGPTPDPVLLLGNSESPEPIPTRSPSETTLVPSPPSSDDERETVCNSPLSLSDCEEEAELTATEDDNIPTKDTSGACSSIQKLEPEQPYDNEIIKESSDSLNQEHHSFNKPRVQTMCSPSFLIKGADVAALHPSVTSSANICSSNTPERHTISAKPIRSHIDTPMYNTGHSRVLCQLSHATGTSRQCNRATKRPLTTHFRQLFKPIPYNDKEEENDGTD